VIFSSTKTKNSVSFKILETMDSLSDAPNGIARKISIERLDHFCW
jgi:hypothetical protein